VENSLKILKVMNFLFTHVDFISSKGIRFIMKANQENDFAGEGEGGGGLHDEDLQIMKEISPSFFHH